MTGVLAERVHVLGGTPTIESGPGRETTVTARIRMGAGQQEPGPSSDQLSCLLISC